MAPLVMLALQLAAKKKQQDGERQAMAGQIYADEAQKLGANTAGYKAQVFENKLRSEKFADAQQMYDIYGKADVGGEDEIDEQGAKEDAADHHVYDTDTSHKEGDVLAGGGTFGNSSQRYVPDEETKQMLSKKYGYKW